MGIKEHPLKLIQALPGGLMRYISILFIITITFTRLALPCTTFSISHGDQRVVGKSYDWKRGHGTAVVNKRNVSKKALNISPLDRRAQWVSRYGSVTFNQHGREFPLSGVNEAGLTVEIMWLDSSGYPGWDNRPVVNELQWIQYQLDRFATVREVVDNAPALRVAIVHAKVHYLVCDLSQTCATVEYLDGKLVTHSDANMFVNVLTNNTYDDSVQFLQKHQGFGGVLPIPLVGSESLDRFVRAAHLVKTYPGDGSLVDYSFGILKRVAQAGYSKWNMVYDLNKRMIHFRTTTQPTQKWLDPTQFEYSCKSAVKLLNLNTPMEGSVTDQFIPYTRKLNQEMIRQGLKDLPIPVPGLTSLLSGYPQRTRCMER